MTDALELLVDLRDDDGRHFERAAPVVGEWPDTSATVWGST